MITFVFDAGDTFGYAILPSWEDAERVAEEHGWELLGERQHMDNREGPEWLYEGETIQ